MSALIEIYIKNETLAIMLDTNRKKGMKGIGITMSVNDTTDQYGNNVSAYVSQTREQREAKTPRYYIGNGKVKYVSDSGISKPQEAKNEANTQSFDLETMNELPY